MRVNAISFEDMTEEEKTILSQQKEIKELKKQIQELKYKQKCLNVMLTDNNSTLVRNNERINYLEKHSTDLQETIDRGYKQTNTFSKTHSGIYRVFNIETDQSYVGQSSINVYDRCMSHFKPAEYDTNDWHYDVMEHPEHYDYQILIEGVKNQGDLDRLEIYYIGKYDCIDNGYNKQYGGRFKFLENYNESGIFQ